MKNILVVCLSILLLASCTLTQQYSFNEDFSGHYQLEFDLSDMANYGNEDPDSVPNVFEGFNIDSVQDAYAKIEGISKIKVKTENNVLFVEYKFADLKALNASLSLQEQADLGISGMGSDNKFSYVDGVFTYNFQDETSAEATPDSIAQMMSFVDYSIRMQFAKPIKSATNGTIDQSGMLLDLSGNLGEIASKEKSLNVQVTFKK
jgi:hypothetical protein